MIRYLVDLIEEIEPTQPGRNWNRDFETQEQLVKELAKEIERLDPRDFAPAAQCEFVVLRAELKAWGGRRLIPFTSEKNPFRRMAKVLQFYGGPNSHVKGRSFEYIADNELRKIVERDYRELSLVVFSAGAWKSTVILAGSILEALLYAALTSDSATVVKANAAHNAPKFKGKIKPIESGEWRLAELIDVASELQILPAERANTIDQVLRDYRNFVHPKKEIRAQHACTEAEALLAKGALEGVCNHFDKLHSVSGDGAKSSVSSEKQNGG
jgi:hypothetical protein